MRFQDDSYVPVIAINPDWNRSESVENFVQQNEFDRMPDVF